MITVHIYSNYAWDQDANTITLYLSIPNADRILKDQHTLIVNPRSIQLFIEDHEGKNYIFKLSNLCGELDPENTVIKFKSKKVVIYIRKKEIGKHWNDLKVKRIHEVFNQLQRQMDTTQNAQPAEAKGVNGYGCPNDKVYIQTPTELHSPCNPFHITTPHHHHKS